MLREFNNLLLDALPDAIVMADSAGGIVFANAQAETLFGYDRGELNGKPIETLMPARYRGAHAGHRSHYSGQPRIRPMGAGLELFGLRKDGVEFPVEISLSPLETGEGTFVVSAIRDSTERRRFERELQEKNLALAEANKELEAFSFSISHDLRAPLRHIHGYVELLKLDIGERLEEKSRHFLEEIAGSAEQMTRLVDDLLEFSRMGRAELRRETTDMNVLVQTALSRLESEAQGRNIRWKISPLPPAHADTALMLQVFVNLISNAIKYTRPRNPAEIEVGSINGADQEAVVFVRDNGVGFEMEHADRLFGVFQRLHLKEDFEGTGIGLANVRRIITRHGGRTWAEGRPGAGATFYFSIPVCPNEL